MATLKLAISNRPSFEQLLVGEVDDSYGKRDKRLFLGPPGGTLIVLTLVPEFFSQLGHDSASRVFPRLKGLRRTGADLVT